jgi:hypothetical protein
MTIRHYIYQPLLSFIGLFLPVINTARSIISSDLESQREYLTYWSVYTLMEVYEIMFGIFHSSSVEHYPLELKLLFVVWLTSPYTQGAYRIYIFLVKPVYESVEMHIDVTIDHLWQRFLMKMFTIGKIILWQVAFAPEDDLFQSSVRFGLKKANTFYNKNN